VAPETRRAWWLERHVPLIVEAYKPHLQKYVVNLR
jgi:hypothetical protein